jgi:hypothetical protein
MLCCHRWRSQTVADSIIGPPVHGPLRTVPTFMVTSDLSAQPGRLNAADSALYWSGGYTCTQFTAT